MCHAATWLDDDGGVGVGGGCLALYIVHYSEGVALSSPHFLSVLMLSYLPALICAHNGVGSNKENLAMQELQK